MKQTGAIFDKVVPFIQKYKYLIVFFFLGLLLITFPSGEKEEKRIQKENTVVDVSAFEKKIESALASCEGVGRAKVILSVDSGSEYIYAKEARESKREDENASQSDLDTKPTVMSEGSGKESPVLVKEIYPEFRGALVICDGAEVLNVKTEIFDAVSALTGLSSDKISVIKMKQ